jgi:hypothetical protein
MSELLTDFELKKLTGRPQKSRQIEWLKKEGIPFRVSATGHPVVTWSAVNGKLAPAASVAAPAPAKWRSKALEA